MSRSIAVLIAEDNHLLRAGIRSLLDSEPGLRCVGEADDGATALEMVRQMVPDVLLIDQHIPGLTGIEVARRLAETGGDTIVLLMSLYSHELFASEAERAGAAGYVVKDRGLAQLPRLIRRAITCRQSL